MNNLIKFEGRISQLEIHKGTLNAFGAVGNGSIASSAILSGVAESVSLASQSVFLASNATLDIHSVVMRIDGKICIGQFHRALIEEGEYVICVGRYVAENIYEVYSVLSPKTGYMHMQVGVGAAEKPARKSAKKGFLVWWGVSIVGTGIMIFWTGQYTLTNAFIYAIVTIITFLGFGIIVNSAFKSMIPMCEISEQIFKIYRFKEPESVYLLDGRFISHVHKLWLESVYEYPKAIDFDPYPESYIEQKEKNE